MPNSVFLNPKDIKKELSRNGLYFQTLKLEWQMSCAPEDVAFNYADIAHSDHVHDEMYDKPIVVTDDVGILLRTQKIWSFLKIPILLAGYSYEKYRHVTYFSSYGIHVINEVRMLPHDSLLSTKIESHYHVGMPIFLLWLRPLIHSLLKRNFIALSKDDRQIRERRGQLRENGCDFRVHSNALNFGPGFQQITEIDKENVIVAKDNCSQKEQLSIDLNKVESQMVFLGTDIFGVQLMKEGDKILVYPRICFHEGACLDNATKRNANLICPWHGKKIPPCITYELETGQTAYAPNNKYYSMNVENGVINVYFQSS